MNRRSMISPRGVSDSSASGFDGSSSDFGHRRVDDDSVDSFQYLISKCCQSGLFDEDQTATALQTGPGKSQRTSLSAKNTSLGHDEESENSTAQPLPFDLVIRDELTLGGDGFQRNLSDIVTQTTASTVYTRDGVQCGVQGGESSSAHEKSCRASTPTTPISNTARTKECLSSEKMERRHSNVEDVKQNAGDEDCNPAEDPALEEYPESDNESECEEGNGNNECSQVVVSRYSSNLSNSSNSIVKHDDTRESQTIPVISPRADLVFSAAIDDSSSAPKKKGGTASTFPDVFESDLFAFSKVLGSEEGVSVEADRKGSSDDLTPSPKKSVADKKSKPRTDKAMKPKDDTFGRSDGSGLPESSSSQWRAKPKRIRSVLGMKGDSKSKKDVVPINSDDPKPKSRNKINTTAVAEVGHSRTEYKCEEVCNDGQAGEVGKNALPSALSSRIRKPRFMRKASPKKVDKIPLLDESMRIAAERHNSDEPSVSSIEKLVNSVAIDISSVTGEVEFASSKAKELFLCELSPIRSAKDGLDPPKLEVRSGSGATESLSMTDESISLNVTGSTTPPSKRSADILPATPPTPTRNGETWNITQSFLFGAASPPSPTASILGRLPLKRYDSVSETIECRLDNTSAGEDAVSVSVGLKVVGHGKGNAENIELPQMPPPVQRRLEYDMDEIGFRESLCRTPFQSRPIEIATSPGTPPPRKMSARDEIEIGREFSSAKLNAFSIQSSFLRRSRCSLNDGLRKNKLFVATSKKMSVAGRGETSSVEWDNSLDVNLPADGGIENAKSNNESIEMPLESAL